MKSSGWWTEWTAINDEEGIQQAWMCTFLCPPNEIHPEGKGVFCPVTIDVDTRSRLEDRGVLEKFMAVQVKGAEIELQGLGCYHELPELVAP